MAETMAHSLTQCQFPHSRQAALVLVEAMADLAGALHTLGLSFPRPVLVLVGGAGGLTMAVKEAKGPASLAALFRGLAQMAQTRGAIVVDGGAEAGVMAMIGRARAEAQSLFPLLGVAAAGTIDLPWRPGEGDYDKQPASAPLDPDHTHFIIVPGDTWGEESPWLTQTATVLAAGEPSVTILINGGEISRRDVAGSLAAGRPTVAIAGTGRLADELTAASNPPPGLHIVNLGAGWDEIGRQLELIWV